jgi:predicted dehydrogenase
MRVGVIGTGAIGAWHARIVAESGDALSAVCDLVPARAEAAAFGAQVFTDPDAFFASGLDAVIVATPEAQHEAHVTAAARAGLAVMVEKPVAPDMEAMRRMAGAVADAGVIAMAAHVERFEAGSAGLKAAVEQGICGRVSAIFARRQFGPSEVARFAGSSSTLRVLGIHDFDLVRWLHPGRIASVQAMAGRGAIHAAHGMDDHVVTTITFEDGAMACVESGWTLPRAYQSYATPEGWGAAGQQPAGGFRRRGVRVERHVAQVPAADRLRRRRGFPRRQPAPPGGDPWPGAGRAPHGGGAFPRLRAPWPRAAWSGSTMRCAPWRFWRPPRPRSPPGAP